MNSKMLLKSMLVAAALSFAGVAAAIPLTYNITVTGDWFQSGSPYGMGLSPTLTGTITVDSSIAGLNGLLDFSLTTGSITWTEDDFVDTFSSSLDYDSFGNLTDFSLYSFVSGSGYMYIFSNDTMGVFDGSESNACNDCVSFAPADVVPEPSSLSLIGLVLLGAAALRRRA